MSVFSHLTKASGRFFHRKMLEGITIGVLAAAVALIAWYAGVLDRFEDATWSWRVQFFARGAPSTASIKLILLDQQSLDWGKRQIGVSWPWPREVYAPVIDFCTRNGARAVIFDVLFSEPSAVSVSDDLKLEAAIGRSPFFVASMCLHKEADFSRSWPDYIRKGRLFDIVNLKEFMAGRRGAEYLRPSATFPIEEVAAKASAIANVIEEPDGDGIFRRVNLFRIFDAKAAPSLGLAPLAAGGGGKPCKVMLHKERIELCGLNVPVDRKGKLILRFRGPPGAFRSYSAASVINSQVNAEGGGADTLKDAKSFKDAYVFFGFSAPGLADLMPTPLGACPAVEIYATLLDNCLSGDFLRDIPTGWVVLSTFVLALAAALFLVLRAVRTWQSVAAIAFFAPAPLVLGFAAYPAGFWWPVVVQELAVAAALTGGVVVNYATEGRQRMFLKKAFMYYLCPAVIERILENPSHLKLGGERKELTIFFSDLEGFSTISERLDPESLTRLLNVVLSDMTDIILDEQGTLDKFEGDAIIAFWNAPADQPDHAERACRAALRCQEKILERSDEYERMAGAPIRMRIGINTGAVVVGNMGSTQRFDYTVLGDAANLASRLEGANKFFGTNVMISSETRQRSGKGFRGRRLGFIRVVGRGTPVEVFELCGVEAGAEWGDFENGLARCLEKNWEKALELFESIPEDPVSWLYAGRCRELLDQPGGDWDAVWNLTDK